MPAVGRQRERIPPKAWGLARPVKFVSSRFSNRASISKMESNQHRHRMLTVSPHTHTYMHVHTHACHIHIINTKE